MYPWLVWNVIFPIHERAKGHDTYRYLKEMEAADRMSGPELEGVRRRKLADLIGYVHRHVPFYRIRFEEAGITPGAIRGPEDLSLLPLMRKDDVRRARSVMGV